MKFATAVRAAIQSRANLKLSVVGRNKIAMIKKLLHTRYRVSDLEKTVVILS